MGWLADRTRPRGLPLMIAGVSILAGGWLAAKRRRSLVLYAGYAIPLGFLGNAATFTPAMNNIQGWFDRRRSTAGLHHLGGGRRSRGFRVARRSIAGLLPDVGWRQTLVIFWRGWPVRLLFLLCLLRAARRRSCAAPAKARARGHVGPCPCRRFALMALLSGPRGFCCCTAMAVPFRAYGRLLRRPGLCRRARLGGDIADPADRPWPRPSPWGRLADYIGPIKVSLPLRPDPDRLAAGFSCSWTVFRASTPCR